MNEYPEHDKLAKISEISQEQGALLEWLQDQGVNLMQYKEWIETVEDDCRRCHYWSPERRQDKACDECGNTGTTSSKVHREGWVPDGRSIQTILAEYHGIDQTVLEREKRAMLAALRQPA